MHATLIHNPEAGEGSPTRAELTRWLSDAGHTVTYLSSGTNDLSSSLPPSGECVVVAGGDGTVAEVIRATAGLGIPVAILPLGTANNIAHSLGVEEDPRDIINRLEQSRPRFVDVGRGRGPWGNHRFVESAGLGLFALLLRDAWREEHRHGHDGGRYDLLTGRGDRMLKVLSQANAVPRTVIADGENLSDDYLFVAAFNMPYIGPRLGLAPDADPGDGTLDLLLVRDADRATLAAYLASVSDGTETTLSIDTRKCETVVMDWNVGSGHLDDALWPDPASGDVSDHSGEVVLSIERRAVQILVPSSLLEESKQAILR